MSINLEIDKVACETRENLKLSDSATVVDEPDAAPANGALGRLAACYMSWKSKLNIPALGYGVRNGLGFTKIHSD